LRFSVDELGVLHSLVLEMEREGKVSRTFRRLEPEHQTEIVDAVLTQVTRSGPRGVTMRGVAEALGIAPATLYTYFEDRETMLEFATRVAARISLWVAADIRDAEAAGSKTLEQSLWEHLAIDLDYETTHRSIVTYYSQAGYRGEVDLGKGVPESIAAGMQARVYRRLQIAEERGELREGLDKETASRLINAMLLVMADARLLANLNDYLQIYPEDGPGLDETLAAAIDIIVHGICRGQRNGVPRAPCRHKGEDTSCAPDLDG
jgi:AcrR family transcriptional regulator